MFWTKFIRFIAFIILITMGVAFCIMYLEPIIDIIEDDPMADLEKFVVLSGAVNMFLVITILAGILMVSEISLNIGKILEKMQNKISGESNDMSEVRNKTWVCRCGARNEESSVFCKSCGKKR